VPGGRPSREAIHERLAGLVAELRTRLGGLPSPEEAEAIWTGIWYLEAHNSTALEGNTLVLKEVETLLAEGRAVGQKELKDYLEVKGYADAAQWVYGQATKPGWTSGKLLTITEVRQVHKRAMTPVWEVAPHTDALSGEAPGNWRKHDIQPFTGGMKPTVHMDVPALINDWVAEVSAIPNDSAPVAEAIAERHAAFERIHPFLDGNGRAGRLLTNLTLVRLGYPPAVIQKRERDRYLDALRKADRGDPGPLGELIARAIVNNLTRFVLPAVAGPARLLPLEALATKELNVAALRMAIHRGRLRAIQGSDRSWRSSRQWVGEYSANRYESLRRPRGASPSIND
jgi:fido (protein-threonine AMPylation protein)